MCQKLKKKMKFNRNFMVLSMFFVGNECIWPAPYEIHLSQSDTFVISDMSDELESEEDEMIQPKDFKRINNNNNNDKYFKIHQMAVRYNKRELDQSTKKLENIKKIPEHNFDLEDSIPWEGGFVDKNGNFIQPENERVYYLNEMAKSLIDNKIDEKRDETLKNNNPENDNYDYNQFKNEYNDEVKKEERAKSTLNVTNVKEDESLSDAVDAVSDFKHVNCSSEEKKGIGLSAIKCIISDLKQTRSQHSALQLIEKLFKIAVIWLCVYIIIAVPCWCSRGWCCCCFTCKWCRPREMIDESKRFFMQNPIGMLRDEKGHVTTFQPTHYEKYAQKRLEKALFNL